MGICAVRSTGAGAQKKKGDSVLRIASSSRAGNGSRTRDIHLGKVALYH